MIRRLQFAAVLFLSFLASLPFSSAAEFDDLSQVSTFGIGRGSMQLGYREQEVLFHEVSSTSTSTPSWGVMDHFWIAGDPALDYAYFAYYIDGEIIPSVLFQPYMICGTGFNDQDAPWGLKWFGKAASNGGSWYHHFRIPFGQSIRITARLAPDSQRHTNPNRTVTTWLQLRGTENLPIKIGDVTLPPTARVLLQTIHNTTYDALQEITFADVPVGKGMLFYHSMSVASSSINYLEGCYHVYTPYEAEWPGVLIATGTEDYFNSAWYFNAGPFHLPDAGLTHLSQSNTDGFKMSAYRIHEFDPVFFRDGFRLTSRNGDVTDSNDEKCSSWIGQAVGSPAQATVNAYTWMYVWGGDEAKENKMINKAVTNTIATKPILSKPEMLKEITTKPEQTKSEQTKLENKEKNPFNKPEPKTIRM